jgi:hypothetical protein
MSTAKVKKNIMTERTRTLLSNRKATNRKKRFKKGDPMRKDPVFFRAALAKANQILISAN